MSAPPSRCHSPVCGAGNPNCCSSSPSSSRRRASVDRRDWLRELVRPAAAGRVQVSVQAVACSPHPAALEGRSRPLVPRSPAAAGPGLVSTRATWPHRTGGKLGTRATWPGANPCLVQSPLPCAPPSLPPGPAGVTCGAARLNGYCSPLLSIPAAILPPAAQPRHPRALSRLRR